MKFKNYITESSLSRVWKHNTLHDCGALTAFRKAPDCGKGEPYTKKQNKQRNKSLLSKLMSSGYGVTKLSGIYPEGGVRQKEESFFIVDLKDTGNLLLDIKKFGELFEQDSILFIPKGSIDGDDKAFLVGTNHCPDNFIKYGKHLPFNKGKIGYDSPIYTSFVNGRPFIFEDVGGCVQSPGNGMGVWSMNLISEKPWENIDI
jgi:hypothetical protein